MTGVWVGTWRGRRLLIACAVVVSTGAAGGAQAAFRIEQEHARSDDLLAFFQTIANLDPIRELRADPDDPWLEAIIDRHEHVLLHPRVDDGIARYGDDVLSGRLERRRAVEAGPERAARVRRGQPHPERAGTFGERGIHKI